MAWPDRGSSGYGVRSSDAANEDVIECKVIMVGTISVGKTSLTTRYVKDAFRTNVMTTIGASYMWKRERYNDKEVKFSLWDTAGQEQFHSLVPMYFREAEAVVLVVDATSHTCAEEAEMWLEKIRQAAPEDVVIFLAVNKVDLVHDRRFTKEDAEEFCRRHPDFDIQCGDVSAKTGEGVAKAFRDVGQRCLDKIRRKKARPEEENDTNRVRLEAKNSQKKEKGCGC